MIPFMTFWKMQNHSDYHGLAGGKGDDILKRSEGTFVIVEMFYILIVPVDT